MLRNSILFFALVTVALTAGRAFWAWLGENPANLSGATYVEFFQALSRGIHIPIGVTGIGGVVLTAVSAVLFRNDGTVFYLLLSTSGLCVVASLVTIFVHHPINAQLMTWSPTALPADYRELLNRWWLWHQVRLVIGMAAMALLFVAVLIRKE